MFSFTVTVKNKQSGTVRTRTFKTQKGAAAFAARQDAKASIVRVGGTAKKRSQARTAGAVPAVAAAERSVTFTLTMKEAAEVVTLVAKDREGSTSWLEHSLFTKLAVQFVEQNLS